jgi:hypothetical protein
MKAGKQEASVWKNNRQPLGFLKVSLKTESSV